MPRHRADRAPLHRTLSSSAGQPASRVRQSYAPSHARSASPAAGQAVRPRQQRMLSGAARGLLVSPWFAAGAGFVIATGAVIYAPHAQLMFGSAIRVTPCHTSCGSPVIAQEVPLLPNGGGDGQLVSPSAPTSSAAAVQTVSYHVFGPYYGRFAMQFSVQPQQSIDAWSLTFAIPGATDLSVGGGATWVSYGPDSGTARGTIDPTVTTSGVFGSSSGRPSSAPDSIQFYVNGTGTPGVPTHCYFNGDPCQFTRR